MEERGVNEGDPVSEVAAMEAELLPLERYEPVFTVSWMWFPHFIATDFALHRRLEDAWQAKWGGKISADLDMDGPEAMLIHEWVCYWIAHQFPLYEGLATWLMDMHRVRQG
jgi:hypothetical protein